MSLQVSGRVLRGVLFIASAVLVFAIMDTSTKHLAETYSVLLVVAVRYLGNLLLITALFVPRQGRALVAVRRPWLVLLRALSLALASVFAGFALQRMPVGETISIFFLAPFGIMLLAGRLLGEKVGRVGWLAAALGFLGVLMIVRPGSGLDPFGVFFASLTALLSVAYNMLSRFLAGSETTLSMLFYAALVGAVLFGATLPWSLHGPDPTTLDLVLFMLMGGFSLLGHFLFTAAFRYAPASVLAPVTYLHLVWAGLLGWLIFSHVPDGWTLVGMAMIGSAGTMAALHARQAERQRVNGLPKVNAGPDLP